MTIDELIPAFNERIVFSYDNYKKIPPVPGCYVITNFQSEILYIGQSVNLQKRFCQHLDNNEKTKIGGYGRPTYFYFLACNVERLNKLESSLLQQYELKHGALPVWNKVNAPTT